MAHLRFLGTDKHMLRLVGEVEQTVPGLLRAVETLSMKAVMYGILFITSCLRKRPTIPLKRWHNTLHFSYESIMGERIHKLPESEIIEERETDFTTQLHTNQVFHIFGLLSQNDDESYSCHRSHSCHGPLQKVSRPCKSLHQCAASLTRIFPRSAGVPKLPHS